MHFEPSNLLNEVENTPKHTTMFRWKSTQISNFQLGPNSISIFQFKLLGDIIILVPVFVPYKIRAHKLTCEGKCVMSLRRASMESLHCNKNLLEKLAKDPIWHGRCRNEQVKNKGLNSTCNLRQCKCGMSPIKAKGESYFILKSQRKI